MGIRVVRQARKERRKEKRKYRAKLKQRRLLEDDNEGTLPNLIDDQIQPRSMTRHAAANLLLKKISKANPDNAQIIYNGKLAKIENDLNRKLLIAQGNIARDTKTDDDDDVN